MKLVDVEKVSLTKYLASPDWNPVRTARKKIAALEKRHARPRRIMRACEKLHRSQEAQDKGRLRNYSASLVAAGREPLDLRR